MDSHTSDSTTDRACPLGFVVVPAFLCGLVWLCVLLMHMVR
jgi:hypothetical protein